MKKVLAHIFGFALLSGAALAGPTQVYSPQAPVYEPEPSLYSLNPYALYGHTFGTENNADGWGAGISLVTPGWLADNFEFGYDWREGSERDLHSIHAYGRLNFLDDSGFKLYGLLGPSFSWGFPETQGAENTWNLDVGLGGAYMFTDSMSVFADYRYRWDLENKLDDSGFVRLGVSIHF